MQTNSAICPNTMKATRASAASPAPQYPTIPTICGPAGGAGEKSNVGSTRFRKRQSNERDLILLELESAHSGKRARGKGGYRLKSFLQRFSWANHWLPSRTLIHCVDTSSRHRAKLYVVVHARPAGYGGAAKSWNSVAAFEPSEFVSIFENDTGSAGRGWPDRNCFSRKRAGQNSRDLDMWDARPMPAANERLCRGG